MAAAQTIGLSMAGAATTMLVRAATKSVLHRRGGAPRLPAAARHNNTVGMVLVLAAASGVVLAFGDILQEQRKRSTELA